MKFGEKLRSLRIQNHLTQSDLAKKLGVSLRTLQNYEAGKIYPKQTEIYARIASLFSVTTDYLLNDSHAPAAEPYIPTEQLVAQIGSLFSGGTLSEEDKDKVLCAINDLYWQAKRNHNEKE